MTLDGKLTRKIPVSGSLSSLTLSQNGKFLIGGDYDGNLRVWTMDGKVRNVWKGHSDGVNSVDINPQGNLAVSGSSDGTVRVWNLTNGQSMALLSSQNEWISYSDDGIFDASKEGGKLLGVTQGLVGYSVDQFAIRNNRPDILLERMGLGANSEIAHFRAQYLKRLKRFGLQDEGSVNDYHIPRVEITQSEKQEKNIKISFHISDDKYRLKKYNVFVNGVPLYGSYGKDVDGSSADLTEIFELSQGENRIELSGINDKGVESERPVLFARYSGEGRADLYFMGFGVSRYRNEQINLKYAHKDVNDLAQVFEKMEGSYKTIHKLTFTDDNVTVENIKKAKEFLKSSGVDDTFVLFIAGHGIHDVDKEETYYFLTHETDLNRLSSTAADFELIENLLQGIPPRKKLFLMDTCESGEVDDENRGTFLAMANSRGLQARAIRRGLKIETNQIRPYLYERDRFIYNDLLRRSGAVVFSSSLGGEFSYEEDKYRNGIFTKAIKDALSDPEADRDGSNTLSTQELRDYVSKEVQELTEGRQHPTIDRDNIYLPFGLPVIR